ncbi:MULTISPECIES: AAA family ATPase [Pseudomonas]|uniref:AAA family ATPase n=1 Tax=Pseudomonas TaxID=286 RepID=UPI000D0051EF|nr:MULTISPECIES: AAA family ATPase [Pseudomonas]PRA40673.1 chromosome segregation protein SMC [Pseudomonas sp. MYb115]QXN49313.1 AAA family ATPase [Pseudomonas fluorescens]WSO23626.1 AAA family ATPase [Pseudomonas fluorescens]
MIRLSSIEFTNFKVFGSDIYRINFNDSDLMLLDGPNGYGKTSVFDAIELALSGTIKRFISTDGRQTPDDVVVAFDPRSDVLIDVVLSRSPEDLLSFRRKLKSPIPTGAQKISRFPELWDVFIRDGADWRPAKQTDVDRILKNNNFTRDFHLFHYVQQEEAASFLKSNSETARATEISQLFGDTAAAEAKYTRLKNTEKRLASQRTIQLQKAELLKKSHNIDSARHTTKFGEVEHRYLLPWLLESSKSPEWDLPEFEAFNQSKFSSFSSELDVMLEFVKNRDFYIGSLPYLRAYRSPDLTSDYICFYNSLDHIQNLEEKRSTDKVLERCHAALVGGDIPDNLLHIFDLLGRQDFEQFQKDQDTINDLHRTSSGLKAIYRKIVAQHKELSNSLASLPEESRCLFCGKPHQNHDELEAAALVRISDFSKLLSDQDVSILTLANNIKTRFIDPVISQIVEFRVKNPVLPDDVMASLKKADLTRERLNKFYAWLSTCAFRVDDIMLPPLSHQVDAERLASSLEEMMRRIHENTPLASLEYQVANEGDAFDRMFREYFVNRNDNLFSINEESVEQKRKYLESCFHSSFQLVLKDIATHTDNAKRLEDVEQKLAEITVKLLKKIRQYKKKLIGDIEIPFYIYSGKILQSHQSGIGQGVFLKDPTGGDELKNVRLVSNYQRDHDVLNTMSSGQISAVVISLTLALNKIYAKEFSPILIDDPVQTMDDINMSSLVELLRNEFPDRQIVLSTHEDKVAKYFIYKYLKYGRRVRQLNLMTGDEYDSLDNYIYAPVVG